MSTTKEWYELDNAAKIIPSTAEGANTRVFRLSCQLFEEVDPVILQEALEATLEEFPYFNCCLKRGIFWYYLEENNIEPVVEEDHLPACSPLYFPGRKTLLYRVIYYKKRINLEMFHVLADGTGAFSFFSKLIAVYLEKAHDLPPVEIPQTASFSEKIKDAFSHYYEGKQELKQLNSMGKGRAYQLTGEKDENMNSHMLEGIIEADKFMALAHEYHTTAGVLITAFYISAILDEMSSGQKKKQNIVVSVPVNLRQFFHSDTIRNFFGVINIAVEPSETDGSLESIIEIVDRSFKEQLDEEEVSNTMNAYSSLEKNLAIKMVPLFFKDLAIARFNSWAKNGVTGNVSNLGKIRMPEEISSYIDYFAAFMTSSNQQVTICTYGNKMVFGEASPFTDHPAMMRFFRKLSDHNISVVIATNDYDEVE